MKKSRGCTTTAKNITLLGDEKLDRCPLIFVRDHGDVYGQLAKIYRMVEKGFLPEAGGTMDQQNQIMQALDHLDVGISQGQSAVRGK